MKVSIVTITHNRGHLIAETIQSVLAQSYTDFEHLIIDDGSTDKTEQVVKSFGDQRIIYRRYHRIANLSKLHNLGIKQASGEIIAVLDSDDLWPSHKLETAVEILKNNAQVDFLTHNIRYFSTPGNLKPPYYKHKADFFEKVLDDVLQFKILPFPVAVFRKSIIADIGLLNESLVDGQQDFLMRVASRYKIYFVADSLTYMRIHPQNIHKSNNLPYFTNYYKSISRLLGDNEIGLGQFSKGIFTNSKSLLKHALKSIQP